MWPANSLHHTAAWFSFLVLFSSSVVPAYLHSLRIGNTQQFSTVQPLCQHAALCGLSGRVPWLFPKCYLCTAESLKLLPAGKQLWAPKLGSGPNSYWDGTILKQGKILESVKFWYENMANILIGVSVLVVISFEVHTCFQHSGLLMKAVVGSDAGLAVKCLNAI